MQTWNIKLDALSVYNRDVDRMMAQAGGRVLSYLKRLPWVTVELPDRLPDIPGLVYAEVDTSCDSCPGPASSYASDGLAPANIPAAQERTLGEGAKVAMIDTGLSEHPLLSQARVTVQESFVDGEGQDDLNGHGTGTTGLVFEVAPQAEIFVLKALNRGGKGRWSWVAQALERAADLRADIAVMALGGPDESLMVEETMALYAAGGGIPVAAAGNSGGGMLDYPGASNYAITVAAVDARGKHPRWSSWAPWPTGPDIAAPGVGLRVLSPRTREGYADASGTSMADAVAGGVLALAIAVGRLGRANTDRVRETRLMFARTATPAWANRNMVGYGIINAAGMVE